MFAAGGHFAAQAIIEGHQQQRLQELTEIALRRAEVAVDFGEEGTPATWLQVVVACVLGRMTGDHDGWTSGHFA